MATYICIYLHTVCALVCVGGEGCKILFYLCVWQFIQLYDSLHLDSTTSAPVASFLPSHSQRSATLPSHYPTKMLEGPQTLSEPPPVKGKCTCLVHVIHVVSTLNLSVDIFGF